MSISETKTFQQIIDDGICVMFFRRGCNNKVKCRGLCTRHYEIALRAVKQGRITWEQLELRCKAVPQKRTHEERDFDKEFAD